MVDQEPKTLEQVPTAQQDALQALDQMLAAEDPNFVSEMNEVQAVSEPTDVVIEATAVEAEDDGKEDEKKEKFVKRLWNLFVYRLKLNFKLLIRKITYSAKAISFALIEQTKIWVPKILKAVLEFLKSNVKAFGKLTGTQKTAFFVSLALFAVMVFLLKMNLKGQWIPNMDQPELKRFSEIAEQEIDVGKEKEFIPLYEAFSLPHFEFLLPKFKSNLKPSPEHNLPMAAMELIITLDTRETAIEMKDREPAVFDRVQRVIESVTYEQMISPLGKEHLKTLIKKELNTILTQGWVEDVSYKTLVLKP